MKKVMFNMKIRDIEKGIILKLTEGYEVKIQDITFIIHRPLNKTKKWDISEKQTGMKIATNFTNRADANIRIHQLMSQIGYDKIKERIQVTLDREVKQ